jgi:hypothetical protein
MSEDSESHRNEIDEMKLKTDELDEPALENVSGGFLVFQFKLVAVKTISWS